MTEQEHEHEQDQNQNQDQDQAQDLGQAQGQRQQQVQQQVQGQVQGQGQPEDQRQAQGHGQGQAHGHTSGANDHAPLADELGIEDLYDPMVGMDGKVFCTAGRDAPIAEFTEDVLILHPPQMPLDASNDGEAFSIQVDARGILLDEFGAPKKVPAATFQGCPIYYFGEQKTGTLKHYAVALAHDGSLHALFYEHGERLTTKDIYELRNKSGDGDLSSFSQVSCDI